MRRGAALVVILLLALRAAPAESCIESIELIPRAAVMMHPLTRYTFAVRVRVNRHADHRVLVFAYDGGPVTSLTARQMDEDSPKTWTFQIRDLPGGKYVFVATVVNAGGTVLGTATTRSILIAPDDGG